MTQLCITFGLMVQLIHSLNLTCAPGGLMRCVSMTHFYVMLSAAIYQTTSERNVRIFATRHLEMYSVGHTTCIICNTWLLSSSLWLFGVFLTRWVVCLCMGRGPSWFHCVHCKMGWSSVRLRFILHRSVSHATQRCRYETRGLPSPKKRYKFMATASTFIWYKCERREKCLCGSGLTVPSTSVIYG